MDESINVVFGNSFSDPLSTIDVNILVREVPARVFRYPPWSREV